MKNPFIQMAVMMAAMVAGFRENFMRDHNIREGKTARGHDGSKPGAQHRHNPAGSKFARKVAKRAGVEWNGEIVHTGELTAKNDERAARRRNAHLVRRAA